MEALLRAIDTWLSVCIVELCVMFKDAVTNCYDNSISDIALKLRLKCKRWWWLDLQEMFWERLIWCSVLKEMCHNEYFISCADTWQIQAARESQGHVYTKSIWSFRFDTVNVSDLYFHQFLVQAGECDMLVFPMKQTKWCATLSVVIFCWCLWNKTIWKVNYLTCQGWVKMKMLTGD